MADETTLRERLTPGTRVRLKQDVDRWPNFIARNGGIGTVADNGADMLEVRMDEWLEGAEEWGNTVQWMWWEDGAEVIEADIEILADQTPQPEAEQREVLARCVAECFAAELRHALKPEQWEEVRRRNRDDPKAKTGSVCHSHDFCDANMPMVEGFKTVFGREPFSGSATDAGDCTEAEMEADCVLINRAWALAMDHHLTAAA